jgi:thioesterase domain-containing protein
LEQARRGGIVPPEFELSALRQLFAVFKTNLLALQQYQPRPYAGSITLFVAGEQDRIRPDDPRSGWADLAGGPVLVHRLPADHYTILKAPYVQLVAAELRRDHTAAREAAPLATSDD